MRPSHRKWILTEFIYTKISWNYEYLFGKFNRNQIEMYLPQIGLIELIGTQIVPFYIFTCNPNVSAKIFRISRKLVTYTNDKRII